MLDLQTQTPNCFSESDFMILRRIFLLIFIYVSRLLVDWILNSEPIKDIYKSEQKLPIMIKFSESAPATTNSSTRTETTNCRRRSWSRAVFSSLQRKGLEKRFTLQKYITKPDRRQLAATLGLTDAQVG